MKKTGPSSQKSYTLEELQWHRQVPRFSIDHWWTPSAPDISDDEWRRAACWEVLRRHPHWAPLHFDKPFRVTIDGLRSLSVRFGNSAAAAVLCVCGRATWPNLPDAEKAIFAHGLAALLASAAGPNARLNAPREAVIDIVRERMALLGSELTTQLVNRDPEWERHREELVGKPFANIHDIFDRFEQIDRELEADLKKKGWRILHIAINTDARSEDEVLESFRTILKGMRWKREKVQRMRPYSKLEYILNFEAPADGPDGEASKNYRSLFADINIQPFVEAVISERDKGTDLAWNPESRP